MPALLNGSHISGSEGELIIHHGTEVTANNATLHYFFYSIFLAPEKIFHISRRKPSEETSLRAEIKFPCVLALSRASFFFCTTNN